MRLQNLLETDKNGNISGAMSPVLMAKAFCEQENIPLKKLARIWFEGEETHQSTTEPGTGHDTLIIETNGTKKARCFMMIIDKGTKIVPGAIWFEDDKDPIITPVYKKQDLRLLTDDQILECFKLAAKEIAIIPYKEPIVEPWKTKKYDKPRTFEENKEYNQSYAREHGFHEREHNKINFFLTEYFCKPSKEPRAGDIVILRGDNKTYKMGLLDSVRDGEASLCTSPMGPHVYYNKESKSFSLSTSGGYWLGAPIEKLKKKRGKGERVFWIWGGLPCGNGGVYFKAPVNVWEYYSEEIY
jgi:hypothetical protein